MEEKDLTAAENDNRHEHSANAANRQDAPSALALRVVGPVLRRLDALAALVTVAIIISVRLFVARPIYLPPLYMIDDSWRIDIAYRYSRGNWLGRDVLFTYGPLYELMTGLPARVMHQSDIGFIYRTWSVIPIAVSILLVYGIGALLLGSEPVWKRLLFLSVLVYFWCPFDVRPILVVFVLAVLVRAMVNLDAHNVLPWAAVASSMIIGAFLVSADAGIYSGAVVVIVVGWAFCFQRQCRRDLVRFGLVTTTLITGWVFVVNAVAGNVLEFRLWRGALEEASNFRWALAQSPRPEMFSFITVILSSTVLVLGSAGMFSRTDAPAITRRPLFLCSGFCIAILCWQSGLVRSDDGHVFAAAFPTIAMIGLVLLGTGPVRRLTTLLLTGLALVASLFVAMTPSHRAWAFLLLANNWTVQRVNGECPSGRQYFQQACMSVPQFLILSGAEGFLKGSADPKAFVFPYENILVVTAKKLAAGGVLQSYAAHGDFLMEQQIESLHRDRPELAIYGVDDISSERVDAVSNLSRSPPVWFYLQQNYRFDRALSGGFVGLRRDDERSKRWKESRESSVNFRPRVLKLSGYGIYDLGNVDWTMPYDFLRLEVQFKYPIWWKLSKPSAVAVLLHFSDGSVKVAGGVFQPNKETEFWIYPWDETRLWRYFLPDPQQWRSGSYRPAVTHLEIRVLPFDAISVLPSAIEIRKAEAVSINLK